MRRWPTWSCSGKVANLNPGAPVERRAGAMCVYSQDRFSILHADNAGQRAGVRWNVCV